MIVDVLLMNLPLKENKYIVDFGLLAEIEILRPGRILRFRPGRYYQALFSCSHIRENVNVV